MCQQFLEKSSTYQIKSSAISSVTISYSFAFIFAHAAAAGARCWGYSPVWKSNTQQRADGQNENQMCGRDTKRCSLETDYHLLLLLVSEIPGNGMLSKNKYAKSASVCLRRRATQLICSVIWNAPHTVVRWIHKASVSHFINILQCVWGLVLFWRKDLHIRRNVAQHGKDLCRAIKILCP